MGRADFRLGLTGHNLLLTGGSGVDDVTFKAELTLAKAKKRLKKAPPPPP